MLKISEPLWQMLKSDNKECYCERCVAQPRIVTAEHYFKEIQDREKSF